MLRNYLIVNGAIYISLTNRPPFKSNRSVRISLGMCCNVGDYTEEQLLQLGNAMLASDLITQKYSHDPVRLQNQVRNIFSTLESWIRRNLIEYLIAYFVELMEVYLPRFQLLPGVPQ